MAKIGRILGITLALLVATPSPADWPPPDSTAPACDATTTGATVNFDYCSVAKPCTLQGGGTETTAMTTPTCATVNPTRPAYTDTLESWVGTDGQTRHACEYYPAAASSANRYPAVLWLHGGAGSADNIYNVTSLRTKAIDSLLGKDSRTGFILISVQASNIHFPTGNPNGSREGPHWNDYFRDMRTTTANLDMQALDTILDRIAGPTGKADPTRLYLMGWSNGMKMAQMYGIARHRTPTPGGQYVAAVAGYAGADPFDNTSLTQSPTCKLDTYPTTRVAPIYYIGRSCDAACGCSPTQEAAFDIPPGQNQTTWMTRLSAMTGGDVRFSRLVGDLGVATGSCDDTAACTLLRGLTNHTNWPDGVADGGAVDWEPEMLTWLRGHPWFSHPRPVIISGHAQ